MRLILVAVVAAAAGFVGGAWWHAELLVEPPKGPAVAPIALAPAPSPGAAAAVPAPAPLPQPPADAPEQCAEVSRVLTLTTHELVTLRDEVKRRDERRVAHEGTPVPPPTQPPEPRFQPEKLRAAVADAFTQARVPGRVDGLDCTEWPCIAYGRIRGTEDEMEKIEGAKALAAYERDILTVLLWVITDEAANEAPLPLLPGKPEQALFAMAFYPRGLERPVAENVDRRLRTRTAELWNTMSPSDETGR